MARRRRTASRRSRRSSKSLARLGPISSRPAALGLSGRWLQLGMEWLEPRRMLANSPVIISEVEAANSNGILDSAGTAADWLEITNTSSTQTVSLNGWKLEYFSNPVKTFTFPNMSLGPDEVRVIFCDSNSATDPTQELHTNFNLSKSSPKNLELLDGSNNVISSYLPYPAETSDISYGVGEAVSETDLVAAGATAKYFAPTNSSLGTTWTQTSFNDSSWAAGQTGLGFATVSGFATTLYRANTGSVASLAQAQTLTTTPSQQSSVTSATETTLNFLDTGGGAHFGSDNPFPGMSVGQGNNYYALTATGTITIPTAGYYTFGGNSDDGFSLNISGASFTDGSNTTTASGATMASDKLQGPTDTFATTFLTAGSHTINVLYYQNAGGAEFELFSEASSSSGVTSFNSSFHLIGDTANGGLAVSSVPFGSGGGASASPIATSIETNVKSTVAAAIQTAGSTSLYTRITFNAANLAALTSLTLRMQFDSGYVAYLNGVQVASYNAPASPTWNSAALEARTSAVQATTYQNVDLSTFLNSSTTGALMATGNVLAIQTLMASPSDQTLFVLPELSQISITQEGLHFFNKPSPGGYNTIDTWQPDLTFSVQHGFFTSPFQLTLTTTTTGATIYYTTDNSTPSATNGTRYTGPITISATTIVRAVTVLGSNVGVVQTESYIFLADVINQPSNPAGFPTGWGNNGSGSEQTPNYGMNPAITQNPLYSAGLIQDLLSLPSVSITSDVPNIFSDNLSASANSGIYTNLDNLEQSNGVQLEVPASFEYFNPSGSISLQANMGLQTEGGVGRDPQYELHSFRMNFSSDYGPSSLNYPLFAGDPVTSYKILDLKAGFNDVWSWSGSGNPPGDAAQYMRDVFTAITQQAMGQPGFHTQYVFLYVDGLFWGLYMMDERPDANFAASYLGGVSSDWEANNAGHEVNGSAANLPYWNELQSFPSSNDMTTVASFEKVQGNNPNGTPNSSYTDLLNMPNYIDYMLMNFYIGNTDWPWHNFYAAIDTADPTGFDFFNWDAEMSLGIVNGGFNSSLTTNVLGPNYSGGDGVATLYSSMYSNPEFDMAFADQARQFLFNNGALTASASIARYQSLVNEISSAMVAESARWGTIPTSPGPLPNTQAAWLNEANWILNTYMPQRTGVLISQLQAAGLYPNVTAPDFYVNGVDEYGGTFNPGNQLTISAGSLPAGAVIYYTLDGSDPRLIGGAVNTASDVLTYTGPITLTQGTEVRARLYVNGTWSAISEAQFTVNLSSIRVTELMYDPTAATQAEINKGYVSVDGREDFEFIEIQNTSSTALPLQGLQFTNGVTFTFPNVTIGAGSYMIVASDQAAFDIRYGSQLQNEFGSNWQSLIVAGQYSGHLSNSGEEVTLTAPNGGLVQDFTYSPDWYPQTADGGFSLTIRNVSQSTSLWNSADGWLPSGEPLGTPGTGELISVPLPGSVVINEVLANPTTPGGDMIELHNTTSQAINVGGWWLSNSSTNLTMYQIAAGTVIAPGGYLVEADAHNYGAGSGDPGEKTPFTLSPYGFSVYLSSNASGQAGGYQVSESFGATPLGISAGLLTNSVGSSSFVLLSSPTFGLGPAFAGAANVSTAYVSPVVINEIMYDPPQPTAAESAAGYTDGDDFEFVELYNRSSTAQSLTNYEVASGVGFTFGWYGDGTTGEDYTLESGATATWTTNALAAGTYTVDADYSLTDQLGAALKVDAAAQYLITYPGGSKTVTIDQSTAVGGKLNLGSITTTGPGTIQVTLTRTSSAAPSERTMANQVEFVNSGTDLIVNNPALTSLSMQSGLTTLAPGGYVVLVSDYAAFNERYNIAANHIPVAGVYTGHLNNGGETVALDLAGAANPVNGYVPWYQTDIVDYSNAAPWPTQAAGQGPSLVRLRPADYGNDPDNWLASNVGGTPGAANIVFDPIAPTTPTGLSAIANAQTGAITLTWSASTDNRSDVDHYNIYRNGVVIGVSATNSYADSTAQAATNYTYSVSAVNRDGIESSQSASIIAVLPGIKSYDWIDSSDIEIYFSEPLTTASAGNLANYSISGNSFTAVNLSRNNTKVTLTTSTPLSPGAGFTISLNGLATASGDVLPGNQQLIGTFQLPTGTILDQVWDNLDGGDAVTDLTNPALNPDYPNSPTYSSYLTSFEAPENTGVNDYGQRIQGYIYAPITGAYTFWIASDDNSQLWLSTDTTPNNAVEIASVNAWTSYRQWNEYASQQSVSINLVAGQRYYIEALMKQGTGGDNLSVAWQIPGTTFDTTNGTPIPGSYLAPYGGTIDLTPPAAPANLQATIGGANNQITLKWSSVVDTTSGIDHYVIYRNGQFYATTTSTTFTDTNNISSQNLATYQVAAVNWDGVQGTESAALSVAPLGVASVSTITNTTVAVKFTEPVDPTSAQTLANYQIPGLSISAAALQSDGITVLLTTSTMGTSSYTLSDSNVHTLAGAAVPTQSISFTNTGPGWFVTLYQANGNLSLSTVENAQTLISTPTDWATAPITATAQVINYATGGASGNFGSDNPLLGQSSINNNVSNYAITATGQIYIPTAGTYTFDGNSDDGFLMTITGATFTSSTNATLTSNSFEFDGSRGSADSFGVATFATAGYYPVSLLMFQGGGPSGVEISAATGTQTAFSSAFQLIGDTVDGGLSMGGSFAVAPFTIGLNSQGGADTSPSLSGTTNSTSVNVTVRVNGVYYAATNNNGAWTLPEGDIAPALTSGAYPMLAIASNSSSQTAFGTSQLTIDTAGPSVQITPPSPTNMKTPLTSVAITFNEAVSGFSLANLSLSLNGLSAPLSGATLTSTDGQHWTLGNLSALDFADGNYQLTVNPAGWQTVSAGSVPLATGASTNWTMSAGTLVGLPSGNNYRIVDDSVNPALADVFINNTTSTPTYTATISGLSQWTLAAAPGDTLTVDFTQGNPLPTSGVSYTGTSGNLLTILGNAGSGAVTSTSNQITVGGSAPINFSNVALVDFNLGSGGLSVAAGTNLTVGSIEAGPLNIGGTAQSPTIVTIAASDAAGNPIMPSDVSSSDTAGGAGSSASSASTGHSALAALLARRTAAIKTSAVSTPDVTSDTATSVDAQDGSATVATDAATSEAATSSTVPAAATDAASQPAVSIAPLVTASVSIPPATFALAPATVAAAPAAVLQTTTTATTPIPAVTPARASATTAATKPQLMVAAPQHHVSFATQTVTATTSDSGSSRWADHRAAAVDAVLNLAPSAADHGRQWSGAGQPAIEDSVDELFSLIGAE